MKYHPLLRFIMTLFIWFTAIFIMAVVISFSIRVLAFYWIGGDYLFSYVDIIRAFKIAVYCALLCNFVSWFLYRYNKNLNR